MRCRRPTRRSAAARNRTSALLPFEAPTFVSFPRQQGRPLVEFGPFFALIHKAAAPAGSRDDGPSTSELVDRARGGDQAAIERLFARHLRPLQRSARGRLPQWAHDVGDTDDLVQDALLQTFKRIGGFETRGVGALQAYLRQAVINRVRDQLRRKGRQPDSTDLDDLELTAVGSPLEEAIGREAVEDYSGALERLKPDERELIVARVEMDYTYEELAQVLGKVTPEAARKAAQRALVRLAEEMKRGRAQPVD
jgi:RNA polymerase sigma-70 factor, ECF subfamily